MKISTKSNGYIPKVSIGMPVYNGEKYIREALDSLLAQAYTDFELIISDNASTDATSRICREYVEKDSRVKYFRQPTNIGILFNFYFVLDQARSEYFMWASHDDKWDKYWVSKLVNKLQHEDLNVVFGSLIHIGEDSKVINCQDDNRTFEFIGNKTIRRISYFLQPENLGKANPIYGLFKRTLLNASNLDILSIVDENAPGVDVLFIYNILGQTELSSVSDTYFYKRIHGSCAGIKVFNKMSLMRKVIQYIIMPIFITKNDFYYCNLSTSLEKFIILISLPLKILWRYWLMISWFIKKLVYLSIDKINTKSSAIAKSPQINGS